MATIFSGIGSIEQALKRLGIEYEIVFACDNGDVELNMLDGEELKEYKRLVKLRSKKAISEECDEQQLTELSQKENSQAEIIRNQVRTLDGKDAKREFVEQLYKKHGKGHNFVKDTYLGNYSDHINISDFHLDVRFFDGTDYHNDKEIDLLVGGSPCQAFSAVGAKYGLNDTRGTLFYEFARIVQETQPRVFIYENVRGLLTHDKGHTWKVMRDVLESLNYRIAEPQILNASDYGIPQSRRRVFVIGIRDDIQCNDFQYPQPVDLKYTMQDFLEDNCANGHFNYDKNTGELIIEKVKGNPDSKFNLSPAVQKYVLAGGTSNYKTSTETDLPIARTLMKMMTQHHRAGVDNYITVQKDPLVLRQLSDREALRLMGYPDDFKIVVSSMQTLRQAGNSIVVDVLMAIVKEIIKTNALI
ncbi:MAG: DNA (cytosine-5-)-methyltransferase [Salinivirgaceae bacterium]|nr:DNA (cytosine-5-)-methyltransferase [Salinivirgaceae bacterium]